MESINYYLTRHSHLKPKLKQVLSTHQILSTHHIFQLSYNNTLLQFIYKYNFFQYLYGRHLCILARCSRCTNFQCGHHAYIHVLGINTHIITYLVPTSGVGESNRVKFNNFGDYFICCTYKTSDLLDMLMALVSEVS